VNEQATISRSFANFDGLALWLPYSSMRVSLLFHLVGFWPRGNGGNRARGREREVPLDTGEREDIFWITIQYLQVSV
jgi:hypothetical protein